MIKSIKPKQPDNYLFVIDTDTYAGNFERQMCAYITGQIGECEVGKEQAELAKQEIPNMLTQLEELIEHVPDEHGCHRPVSIFPNDRYGNDGVGNQALLTDKNRKQFPWPAYNSVVIYFNSIPNRRVLNIMKERARNFAERKIELKGVEKRVRIEGFRLLEEHKQITYRELNL